MKILKQLKVAATVCVLASASCTNNASTYPDLHGPSSPVPGITEAADSRQATDDYVTAAAAPAAEAANVAESFGQAWFDTSHGPDAWRNRLRPLCEPGLWQALQAADPGRLTGNQIQGSPQITPGADGATWLHAVIPASNGYLILTVAPIGGHWLVSNADTRRSLP